MGRRMFAGQLSRVRTFRWFTRRGAAGGDLAAKQPWRNLLAQCLRFVPDWQDYPETAGLQQQNWSVPRAPLSAASMPVGLFLRAVV